MKEASGNPTANRLPAAISDESLQSAVAQSGYPLQLRTAALLINHFYVQEEWCFQDRETGQFRSLDISATRELRGVEHPQVAPINPAVSLLVECKRSELPYVFFRSVSQATISEFPLILGLRGNEVALRDRQEQVRQYTAAEVFGLVKEPFISPGPIICATFSKAVRKGKDLELSGSDPFNSVILPLVNAVDHAATVHARHRRSRSFEPRLTLPVCVLDSAMIVADVERNELELRPWVRLIRQEVRPGEPPEPTYYAVDFVHIGFLAEWIEQCVLPFADTFAERVTRRPLLVLNMGGRVDDFDTWTWDKVRDPSGA